MDTTRVPQPHRDNHQAREVASRVPGYVLRVLRPHLRTEDPAPPGPLYALLSLSRSGVKLCPLRLLLGGLRRFLRLFEGFQLRLKRCSPLLCHLPTGTFGSELLPNLSQLAHKWP